MSVQALKKSGGPITETVPEANAGYLSDSAMASRPKPCRAPFRSDEIRLRSVLSDYTRSNLAARHSPHRGRLTSARGCIAFVQR